MLRISISFKTATQAFRACLMLILVTTTPVQGDDLAKTFPIQDGSVVCRAESDLTAEVVFPYMPFLSTTPTWSPSLPNTMVSQWNSSHRSWALEGAFRSGSSIQKGSGPPSSLAPANTPPTPTAIERDATIPSE